MFVAVRLVILDRRECVCVCDSCWFSCLLLLLFLQPTHLLLDREQRAPPGHTPVWASLHTPSLPAYRWCTQSDPSGSSASDGPHCCLITWPSTGLPLRPQCLLGDWGTLGQSWSPEAGGVEKTGGKAVTSKPRVRWHGNILYAKKS